MMQKHTAAEWPVQVVPRKLYHVGDIAAHTGLSRQTIHNYDAAGLIRHVDRTAGGHRLYDEQVFHRLKRIAELKGKTTRSMAEIAAIIAREFDANVKKGMSDSCPMSDSMRT